MLQPRALNRCVQEAQRRQGGKTLQVLQPSICDRGAAEFERRQGGKTL